jgi:glycyl-tRNA synthetase alpha subunit
MNTASIISRSATWSACARCTISTRLEAEACIAAGLVLPAHDYVLKCSHTFNALDCRGAIGVTERQVFYGQMRADGPQGGRALPGTKEGTGISVDEARSKK